MLRDVGGDLGVTVGDLYQPNVITNNEPPGVVMVSNGTFEVSYLLLVCELQITLIRLDQKFVDTSTCKHGRYSILTGALSSSSMSGTYWAKGDGNETPVH